MKKIIFLILLIILFIFNLFGHYSTYCENEKKFIKYQCEKSKKIVNLELNKNRVHAKIKDNVSEDEVKAMLDRNDIINYHIDMNEKNIYIVNKSGDMMQDME